MAKPSAAFVTAGPCVSISILETLNSERLGTHGGKVEFFDAPNEMFGDLSFGRGLQHAFHQIPPS